MDQKLQTSVPIFDFIFPALEYIHTSASKQTTFLYCYDVFFNTINNSVRRLSDMNNWSYYKKQYNLNCDILLGGARNVFRSLMHCKGQKIVERLLKANFLLLSRNYNKANCDYLLI